jgi:hypothetical protein
MSRRAPSWLSTTLGQVYTLHFWPPYGDPDVQLAKHYTGWAEAGRLVRRLTEHSAGRGARLTQVQREAGGTWVVADVQPGTRDREQQLKERGAARRCGVCKAVADYESGRVSQPEALARAGWLQATPHERGILLEIFDLEQAPEELLKQLPEQRPEIEMRPFHPAPEPGPAPEITPELLVVVDELEKGWLRDAAGPDAYQARVEQQAELFAQSSAPRPEYLGWTGEPEVGTGHRAAAEPDLADSASMPARSSLPGGHSRAPSQPSPEPQMQTEAGLEVDVRSASRFRAAEAEPELELAVSHAAQAVEIEPELEVG